MATVRRWLATTAAAAAVSMGVGAPGAPPGGAAQTTADRCYLAALHEVFLDRPASVYDLEAWTDRYEPHGPARPHAARLLAASDEWLTAVVTGIYQDALDRAPDDGGLAFWIDRLRGGTRVTTLTAQVYGTEEVWARSGSTAEGFVADVFPRIMGREPTGSDIAYWAGELGHQGPGDVAKRLLGSIENRRARVTALYQQILGREPDVGGRDYWAARLSTVDDVQLAVSLAASPEAHARAQVGCSVPPPATTVRLTQGDRSSVAPQISADGRYVAFLSRARNLVAGDTVDEQTDLFLRDLLTGTTTKVTHASFEVGRIDMSADGRHVAFTAHGNAVPPAGGVEDDEWNIYSWDRVTGAFTLVTDGNGGSQDPKVSADGRYIAYGSSATDLVPGTDPNGLADDVFVWDRTTDTTERITASHPQGLTRVDAISADGSTVAVSSRAAPVGAEPTGATTNRTAYLWHRADGSFTQLTGFAVAADLADDGDVVGERNGSLHLWDAQTATDVRIVRGDTSASFADITPDGASVTFTSGNDRLVPGDANGREDVFVWERATGTIVRLTPDGDGVSFRSTTSADGRRIVFGASGPPGPGAWSDLHLWDRGS